MKLIRTIYWILFATGSLLLAGVYLPYLWYLERWGRNQRRDEIIWKFAHWWGRVVLGATGSKVTVRGAENIPSGSVVVMGNHQSYFDIMLVLGYIDKPLAFIAKKELARAPIVAPWVRQMGGIFLDRKDVRQAARVFQQAVEKVKGGYSMVIFPEGTRSRSAEMGDYKKGSMKLPLRAEAPIVPVSIDGTYKVFEGNGYRIGSTDIILTIAPPIMPQDYAGKSTSAVAEMVREQVEGGLKDGAIDG